jgi:hypothetical protein
MSFVIVVGILKSQERNQYSVQLSNWIESSTFSGVLTTAML